MTKDYQHIISLALNTPWAILPEKLAVILDLLALRANGGTLSEEEIQARIGAVARPQARTSGAIAVLPLHGVIIPRGDMLAESSGAVSVERFTAMLRQALADPQVGGIIIDIDSPGGIVSGVEELSSEIFRARSAKPLAAIASPMAASAAYWIGTAAGELAVMPSGEVGSIGVFAAHEDISGMLEQQGVKVSLVSAGKYKVEGSPFGPLTEEAMAYIQERVNDYYGMFIRAVARNRGVAVTDVRSGFGEGRVVGAQKAIQMGMADRVATLDEMIQRMARNMGRPNGAKAIRLEAFTFPTGPSLDPTPFSREEEDAILFGDGSGSALPPFLGGPLPSHKSPGLASKDTAWDGPTEVAKADQTELHLMCAWYDDSGPDADGDGYPDRKADYKLPHHRAGDHYLVSQGLYAAAQRVDQAQIPDGDRAGVRDHLANHYDELGEKPPWAASANGLDIRRRRLELAGQIGGGHIHAAPLSEEAREEFKLRWEGLYGKDFELGA